MPNRSREIWRSGLGKYEFEFRCEFEASPIKSWVVPVGVQKPNIKVLG